MRAVKLKSSMSGKYLVRNSLTTIPTSVGTSFPFSLPVFSDKAVPETFPSFSESIL